MGKAPAAALAQVYPCEYIFRGVRQSSPSSRDALPVLGVAKIPPNLGDRVHLFTQPVLEEGEA